MRRAGRRISQAITVALLAVMAAGTAYLAVSATGCEGDTRTGFCAAPDMPPVVSWDRGPTGSTVWVGPVVLRRP